MTTSRAASMNSWDLRTWKEKNSIRNLCFSGWSVVTVCSVSRCEETNLRPTIVSEGVLEARPWIHPELLWLSFPAIFRYHLREKRLWERESGQTLFSSIYLFFSFLFLRFSFSWNSLFFFNVSSPPSVVVCFLTRRTFDLKSVFLMRCRFPARAYRIKKIFNRVSQWSFASFLAEKILFSLVRCMKRRNCN